MPAPAASTAPSHRPFTVSSARVQRAATAWSTAAGGGLCLLGVVCFGAGNFAGGMNGGSYYLITGIGLVAAGILVLKRRASGVLLTAGLWAMTMLWSLWAIIQNDPVPMPRVEEATLVLILAASALPGLLGTESDRRDSAPRGRPGYGAAVLLCLMLFGAAYLIHAGQTPLNPVDARAGDISTLSTVGADGRFLSLRDLLPVYAAGARDAASRQIAHQIATPTPASP